MKNILTHEITRINVKRKYCIKTKNQLIIHDEKKFKIYLKT
jgi:hypothetical protein